MTTLRQLQDGSGRAGERYYTIAQAAQKLRVHRTTVQRWISAGKLRAYRVGTGTRTVRITERDLEAAIRPARAREEGVTPLEEQESAEGTVPTKVPTRRLTEEEIERGLAALERLRAFREEIAARHGGPLRPSSEELIRRAREERSERL
jgi:excisionase family DNA binding protein